jgi:hypothetical protein
MLAMATKPTMSLTRTKTAYTTGGPRDLSGTINRMAANGARCFGSGMPKISISRRGADKGQLPPESSVDWS